MRERTSVISHARNELVFLREDFFANGWADACDPIYG